MTPAVDTWPVGRRISFDGALCTVRYHGKVSGTKGDWLGVEWDDTSRGKHSGQHQGKEYFQCLSKSPTAASFTRPSRPHDPPQSFFSAITSKYAPKPVSDDASRARQEKTIDDGPSIEISGKTVEEVGFDRIWKQLATFEELRIVILDTLRLRGVSLESTPESIREAQEEIKTRCPKIQELDLSRNLLEVWNDVADICRPLKHLRILKVSGNRLKRLDEPFRVLGETPFSKVQELYLDDCLATWQEVSYLISSKSFPNLRLLSLSGNGLSALPQPLDTVSRTVGSLFLDDNKFTSIDELLPLFTMMPNILQVSLRGNRIDQVQRTKERPRTPFSTSLQSLNLTNNAINSLKCIDDLPFAFPALASLRVSGNPLYAVQAVSAPRSSGPTPTHSVEETSYMLTLARIGRLKTLNHSNITAQDRMNGELYYISHIERELTHALETGQRSLSVSDVSTNYPRYFELCKTYDREPVDPNSPTLKNQSKSESNAHGSNIAPGSLAARLLQFRFYERQADRAYDGKHIRPARLATQPVEIELPKTISTYTLKGLLSRRLDLRPLSFRLVYESTEVDPIAETFTNRVNNQVVEENPLEWDSDVEWDIDPEPPLEGNDTAGQKALQNTTRSAQNTKIVNFEQEGRRWKKREVELMDSTRDVGFWLDEGATKATVRIEMLV